MTSQFSMFRADLVRKQRTSPMVWWQSILLLVGSLVSCHAKKTDPLIRWLDQLRIDIPDQSYKNGLLHLTVRDLHCTHFTIQSMESTVASIGVYGVGASCEGGYDASGMKGELNAKLGSSSNAQNPPPDFQWGYKILNAKNTSMPIPDALETVSCETHIAVTDLRFHGSWSAKLIDLFRAAIEAGINDAVSSDTICPQFRAHVDPMVTDYIRRAVAYLQRYLPDQRGTIAVPVIEASSERWLQPINPIIETNAASEFVVFPLDLPVLTDLLGNMNNFVNEHLNKGLLTNATVCNGGFSHGFNGIMRNMVPSIQIDLPMQFKIHHLYKDATVVLDLKQWKFAGEGLHRWEDFVVLRPNGDVSFSSHVKTTDLDISVQTSITVDIPSSEPLLETFEVNVSLSSIELAADVAVELDRLLFGNVTTGHVLTTLLDFGKWTPALACLVESVSKLYLESLVTTAHVASLQLHTVNSNDDHLEEDVDTLINHAVGFVLDQYETLISKILSGLSRSLILDDVNSFLDEQIQDMSSNCSHSDSPATNDDHSWTDFTQIEPLERLNRLLHDPETLHHLNSYIDCATTVVGKLAVEELAGLSSLIQFDDIQLEHFGSIQTLFFLLPTNISTIESAFSIGGESKQPTLRVHSSVPAFKGDVSFSVSLSNLTMTSTEMILYDQNVLLRMPMVELLSKGQCLLAPIHEMDFVYFDGSLGRLHVNSSAHFRVHDITYAVNLVSADFPEIQDFTWTIFEWSISTLQKAFTTIARTTINSAHRACDSSGKPSQEFSSQNDRKLSAHSLWVILGTLFILAQPLILLFRHGKDKNGQTAQLSTLSAPLLQQSSPSDIDDDSVVQEISLSLMQKFKGHSVHYILPVLILMTVVLFLASNSSVGATVDLSLSVQSQSFDLPSVYKFGLIDTAKNMLNAGIYPLLLLVVVFSGIWPYAKLFLMFAAWVVPDNILSVKRRENLLRTLDSCSKYSLVDTYVFIGTPKWLPVACSSQTASTVMLVAFRYHVESDEAEYFAFDVFVTPLFGFYGFLLATTMSLVIGHVMVYHHRREALQATLSSWSSESTTSVMTHKYILTNGHRSNLSPIFVLFVVGSLALTVSLLAFGFDQRSFSFEFGGVAGYLLGKQKSHVAYSVLSLWRAIPKSVNGGGFAATLLQASFFFYTVATPFICLLLLSLLMICPLSLPGQIQLLSAAEIANSWSAVDVFVLSILAALFEISTFSSFIVGDKCYLINEITSSYTELDDPSCFNVKCSVALDSVYLIMGTFLLSICSTLVLRLTRLSIMERIAAENSIPSEGSSFIALLANRFPWICAEGGDREEDVEDLPVIAEDRIAARWNDSALNSGIWEETTLEDPSWKDWKDTTNVT